MIRARCVAAVAAVVSLFPQSAFAAAALDGAALSWPWALPFVGILASIAIGPLVVPKFWHDHYGKIAFVWCALTLAPLAALHGTPTAFAAFAHTMLAEYKSFILLLFALYTVAGGILVTGSFKGTPLTNTVILALGTVTASIVGTTGAAMILIRPLLAANAARVHNVHVVIFFIFLVANIGGALTPLGDPPLLVGFLRGVDFFWTTQHLLDETALVAGIVLFVFVLLDIWFYRQDRRVTVVGEVPVKEPVRVRGGINFVLIALIAVAILISAAWNPEKAWNVLGVVLELQDVVRDGALLVIALLSLMLTPRTHRAVNGFTWGPILEVIKLFAGIFICIIPVIAMLQAGRAGAFGWVLDLVTRGDGSPNNIAYFWLTGLMSALLDNAPTYLVFFELTDSDAGTLMGPLGGTLAAISMGAVYMGALTYIGNAPNLMIYAIAVERGVKMPSFFGYMAWACLVLIPIFVLLTYVSIWR
jgi:Na+/H+ antiporter NhaD/arsenite permease-like protein